MPPFDPEMVDPVHERLSTLCCLCCCCCCLYFLQVMPPFDPEMVEPVHERLAAKGVELCLGDGLKAFEQQVRLRAAGSAGVRHNLGRQVQAAAKLHWQRCMQKSNQADV